MNPDDSFDRLLAAEVFAVENDHVRTTDDFEAALAATASATASHADLRADLAATVDDPAIIDFLVAGQDRDGELVPAFCEIRERVDGANAATAFDLTVIYLHYRYAVDPDPVVPESFFPITGDGALVLPSTYAGAILYVWTHECKPCEAVCKDLDTIFVERPDDLGLFAVQGDSCRELLETEFDVHGAPTLLFFESGAVASRLVGPPYRSAIEIEIERVRSSIVSA